MRKAAIFLILLLVTTSCSSAYYAMWEKLGKQKRDLLRDNALKARQEQVETNTQFKDALEKLRASYPIKPTELSKTYDRLSGEYEQSKSKADSLQARIEKMNSIARDLFREWEREAESMSSSSLRSQSLSKLEQTKDRYEAMHSSLQRAHAKTEPVLSKFRDNVLFLKHNLNAQVVGALDSEASDMTREIDELIRSMNQSISETDKFLGELG